MKKVLTFLLAVAILFILSGAAQAAVYGVTSRADLAGDDYVDWSGLGSNPSQGSSTPRVAPFSIFTAQGLPLTINVPPDSYYGYRLLRHSVQNHAYPWFGNFKAGDHVVGVWSEWQRGPIVISFETPVYGVGTQINTWIDDGPEAWWIPPFGATIEAYDINNVRLGTFYFRDFLTIPTNGDNSASFAGVISDSPDIAKIVISIDDNNGFGGSDFLVINKLDIVTAGPPLIPENTTPHVPGTLGYNGCVTALEYALPEGSSISSVVTDGYTAIIEYTGGTLSMDSDGGNMLPIVALINEAPGELTDLEGVQTKEVSVSRQDCRIFNLDTVDYTVSEQWRVLANFENNGGGNGGGNGDGGGGDQGKPAKFEGFIDAIGVSDILLDKEGTTLLLTVTGQTEILVNEQPAAFADLQPGDKAKAKYDSATNEAIQIMVEQ